MGSRLSAGTVSWESVPTAGRVFKVQAVVVRVFFFFFLFLPSLLC